MVKLLENTINTCVFTLTEQETVLPSEYYFDLIFDQTGVVKSFSAIDSSTNTDRYNLFYIETINNSSEVLSGSTHPKIYLKNFGFYTYNIYQSSAKTESDLVEYGRIKFIQTGSTKTEYSNTYNKKTIPNI